MKFVVVSDAVPSFNFSRIRPLFSLLRYNFPMSRLLLIDGHAIAHRAYHSIPPLTSNGQPVNLIYGFYSMFLSAINQLQPKYVIVCLDSPGPVFRNQDFIGYRAKRPPADQNLVVQLPQLKDSLDRAHISNSALTNYEADDLIATLARQSLKRRHPKSKKPLIDKVTIITGDKDLMQLVTSKIEIFMPIRGLSQTQTFHPKDVTEKLGVKPNQVVDLKALMGDSSDNYPGVTGVGPKTATRLLLDYGHLDNIYRHLEDIAPAVRARLEKDKDNAYLSQKLAQLVDDAPVKLSLKKARWSSRQTDSLIELFQSYNFRSLISRLNKAHPQVNPKPATTPPSPSRQNTLF